MQSKTGLWNPFQQEAARAKNLAGASENLDVCMKNMSIQGQILNSLKGKAFGGILLPDPFGARLPADTGFWQLCLWCCWCFWDPKSLLAVPSVAAPVTGEWVCWTCHPLPGLGSTLGLSLEFLHMAIRREAADLCREDQPKPERGHLSSVPLSRSSGYSYPSSSLYRK